MMTEVDSMWFAIEEDCVWCDCVTDWIGLSVFDKVQQLIVVVLRDCCQLSLGLAAVMRLQCDEMYVCEA